MSDLSGKDKQYVAELIRYSNLNLEKGEVLVTQLTVHMFPVPGDYFKGYVPQRIYKAYKEGNVSKSWEYANRISPEECVDYTPSNHSLVVYIPTNYTGAVAYGISVSFAYSKGVRS